MWLQEIDVRLFKALNSFIGTWPWFDKLIKLTVNDYTIPVMLTSFLVALWFLGRTHSERYRYHKAVTIAAAGIGLANLIIFAAILPFFTRERPYAIIESANLLFYKPTVASFPSVPAATVFALASGVMLAHRQLGTAALVLAAYYSFARVYAGVHFPLDAVAGAMLGLTGTGLAYLVIWALKPAYHFFYRGFRIAFLA